MSGIDRILERASAYQAGFDKRDLTAVPRSRVAIVACMDARVHPFALFGLEEGDAHVIRNAGGVVTDDVVRSLCLSQRLLGTEEVLLLHHTGCGMLTVDDEAFAAELERESGERPPWQAGGFRDVEENVRQSLRRLLSTPFLPRREDIRGFVYDVDTGAITEVTG